MTLKLIAFTGLKGSGKDTAASVFVDAGYEHIKMAGALKDMLRALLTYQGVEPEMIERYVEGDRKEQPCTALSGQSMRRAMVTLGTEWGRDIIDPEIWIDVAARRCGLFPRVVISDIRFPNEADMVHRLGGQLIRLERGERADAHPSEAQVRDLPADFVVYNDFASADCLKAYIRARFLR